MAGFADNGRELVLGPADPVILPPGVVTPLPNIPPAPPIPGQFTVLYDFAPAGNLMGKYAATQPQPGPGAIMGTDAGPGMLILVEPTMIVGTAPAGGSLDPKMLNTGNCPVAMNTLPGQIVVVYLS
jgi:hypothetical protein